LVALERRLVPVAGDAVAPAGSCFRPVDDAPLRLLLRLVDANHVRPGRPRGQTAAAVDAGVLVGGAVADAAAAVVGAGLLPHRRTQPRDCRIARGGAVAAAVGLAVDLLGPEQAVAADRPGEDRLGLLAIAEHVQRLVDLVAVRRGRLRALR